jgi:hypothetical protein
VAIEPWSGRGCIVSCPVATILGRPFLEVDSVVSRPAGTYCGNVTSKEQLVQLVKSLPEEQVDELLRLAKNLYELPGPRRPLPAFVGIGDSDRTDVSEHAEELMQGGFGL